MTKPYTVSLQDFPGLPIPNRIAAEVRYVRELERALGGPDAVPKVYEAWVEASESSADQLAAGTAELAVRWPRAAQAAALAGLRDLGDAGEAFFDVRLTDGDTATH
jgi:hypothetical protein